MKIFIASDHRGFNLKKSIVDHLRKKAHEVVDIGPEVYEHEDDYPDYVIPLMNNVAKNDLSLGVVICGNGVGVSMLANKNKKIRCGLAFSVDQTKSARTDDNINVLALAANYTIPNEAIKMVDAFISTTFSNAERHIRRINKVESL